MSLAVGVAVVRALEAEGFAGIELKWPNDLVHRHLKVGGILIEFNGDALGPSTVVVGVGLNVRMPREVAPRHRAAGHRPARRSRAAARQPIDRNRLLARLVAELATTLATYAEHGFAPFAAEWQHRHAYQGKPVKLCCPTAPRSRARSPASTRSGALVLADGPRRARFLSGEISLRRGS